MLGRTAGSGFHPHPWAAVPPATVCKPAGTYTQTRWAFHTLQAYDVDAAMPGTPECTQRSLLDQPQCTSPARGLLLLLHQSAPSALSAAAGMRPAASTTTQQSRTCASSSSTPQDVSRACLVWFCVCGTISTLRLWLQAPEERPQAGITGYCVTSAHSEQSWVECWLSAGAVPTKASFSYSWYAWKQGRRIVGMSAAVARSSKQKMQGPVQCGSNGSSSNSNSLTSDSLMRELLAAAGC